MSSRPIPDDLRASARRGGSVHAFRRVAANWLILRLRLRRARFGVFTVALLCGLPLCLMCGLMIDVPLIHAARLAPPDVRGLAEVFGDLGQSSWMLILSAFVAGAAYLVLKRGRLPRRAPLLGLVVERALFVFAAVAVSGIAVQVVKHVVGRARPKLIDQMGAFHFDPFSLAPSLASFPSGHSTSIFALATALGLIVPRLRWPVFGLAVLVGFARVVQGAHYPSDILAGATFGALTTLAVASLFATRSIGFTRAHGVLRLKGCGMIWSALRPHGCHVRTGG